MRGAMTINTQLKENKKLQKKILKAKTWLLIALLTLGLAIAVFPFAAATTHTDVNAATAWTMMSGGLYPNLVILDVRNQSEFNTGYIPRAVLMPIWQLQQRIGELSAYKNNEIIVYCKTGGIGHNASLILDANNFTKVYDMNGGITAWNSSGYPIETPTSAGYRETIGTLDGAQFLARFPNSWNGMLVVLVRGHNQNPITNVRAMGVINVSAPAILNRGAAFAASTLAPTGYCVKQGMNSTYQLTKYLIDTYRITGKVFLYGISMGGNIALLLAEKYPNLYSGVLDFCGTKDLKAQYDRQVRWANMSDAALTAELTSLAIPVPPTGYANLTAFRDICTYSATTIANETGGTPATMPKAYEDISPTYHANISIPVIDLQGAIDPIVPMSQSAMYQAAVAKAGRSSLYRLYVVADAAHASTSIMSQAGPRFDELVKWSEIIQQGWTLTQNSRAVKAYPDLREYVWEKNASLPPNGQNDKIGLHRLVKTGVTPRGVVFLTNCPMWGAGEQRISNPTNDTWTKYENYSQAIYFANRGYDVYAIDYRTHFIPKTLNASQMSFAANWGLDVWVSDIKEAAEKVKEVSGSKKFFIAGECSGGMAALDYATKYWKDDLRGIILLDANRFVVGYPIVGRMTETNTINLTTVINDMNTKGNWTYDPFGTLRPMATYALQNPGGPAVNPATNVSLGPPLNPLTNKTWTNITEWFSYGVQYNFGVITPTSPAGIYSNIMGGYGNITQDEFCFANSEPLPTRLIAESAAMVDWVNCPYLTYDYNDHYNEIGVPVLAFAGPFSNRTGTFRFVNGINTYDFTPVWLANYGHLDFYMGTYSARDVSQPVLDWMLSRYQLPSVSAFSSVTVMAGQAWSFLALSNGGVGTYTYQWYEGTTMLTGQTSMTLPVSKSTAGTYTYTCKVADAEGTTTTSNPITLTVITPPTPQPPYTPPYQAPTTTPRVTPSPPATSSPTPTPTPTTTPTTTPTPTSTFTPTPSLAPTETPTSEPTTTPTQTFAVPIEATVAIGVLIVVLVAALAIFALRKWTK